jgi:hypothetical protein
MRTMTIAIALVLCAPALGAESTPKHRLALVSRITCPAIREAVKLYGEAAAEYWARGHGFTDVRIEQAKRCLK